MSANVPLPFQERFQPNQPQSTSFLVAILFCKGNREGTLLLLRVARGHRPTSHDNSPRISRAGELSIERFANPPPTHPPPHSNAAAGRRRSAPIELVAPRPASQSMASSSTPTGARHHHHHLLRFTLEHLDDTSRCLQAFRFFLSADGELGPTSKPRPLGRSMESRPQQNAQHPTTSSTVSRGIVRLIPKWNRQKKNNQKTNKGNSATLPPAPNATKGAGQIEK